MERFDLEVLSKFNINKVEDQTSLSKLEEFNKLLDNQDTLQAGGNITNIISKYNMYKNKYKKFKTEIIK